MQPLVEVSASLTTLPMPSGATLAPSASGAAVESCDATASLRPSPEPGPAVQAIRDRGRLIVGLDQSTNLFSFRDPVSAELQGFDVDVAREVARDLVGDPEKVDFRLVTSPERISALQHQKVDIVVNSMTITCARAEEIAFSTVYFEAAQRLLVPKDSPVQGPGDLAGRRVCAQVDTTSLATIARVAPAATLLAVQNSDDCLIALQQGQADAASTDDSILAGMAVQDPNLHIVGPSLERRAVRYRSQSGTGRSGPRGQCQPGTDPSRRDLAVALPEVAHRARPGAESTSPDVSGLTWLETRERARSW